MLHRTLVVANLTSQTPILLQEIERRAAEQPVAFTLLVPDARKRVDWTLEAGVTAIKTAARGGEGLAPAHVDGLLGDTDAFAAVKKAVETGRFDDVLDPPRCPGAAPSGCAPTSPRQVETLGLPVARDHAACRGSRRRDARCFPRARDGRDGS